MRAFAAFLIALCAAAEAQDRETVAVSVTPAKADVRVGSSAHATLLISVAKGWHINSAAPADSELVATAIAWTAPPGLAVAAVRFPAASRKVLAFSASPLEVYEGTVPVALEISAAEGTAPGEYAIPVDLSYQACNNDVCLPPAALRVTLPVRVLSP
ncbi:MAG TPA: protein-disulfide reductase DsbD domain-containing protein [Bacteroidota bacterium]|nr:protein-disulfide reductase DsbD domain-containing protein [Bacteroidota bacterium]